MRSLFLKIFLSFWTTAIGVGTALALMFWLEPDATPTRHRIGWTIALLLSGGICYLLTRYLTSPVLRLRDAARRLAEGELTARATDVKPRGDEIGDLVRDFNFMASRIEELVMSQRQLISDMSHELRSPLARINATLGVARQRFGQDELFDRIERDTRRLDEMIGRLLTLARLDMIVTSPEGRPTNLAALVEDTVADAQLEAAERNCHVAVVCECRSNMNINSDLVRSAVENVIRNAVRYTAVGTTVEVRVECGKRDHNSPAIVKVSDRGPGVPPDELDNIFRPFYRVADARDRQSGGVGLGLAIAQRVSRVHGGSIRAQNRPDGGLEVTLTLKHLNDEGPYSPPCKDKLV